MKKMIGLNESRNRYIRCTFCQSKTEVKELIVTRADGNGNVFHVCEECLKQIKEEVKAIEF